MKITQDKFLKEVYELIHEQDHTVVESIIEFCEKYELEPESVTKYVKNNQNLKSRLTIECMERNLIEKQATLPL